MSARVSEDVIRSYFQWARNYEEIAYYEKLPGGGRCWLVVLVDRGEVGPYPDPVFRLRPEEVVPTQMMLTSREALCFGYGLAVAGALRDRRDWTSEDHEAASERIQERLAPIARARAEEAERQRQENIRRYREKKARDSGARTLEAGD